MIRTPILVLTGFVICLAAIILRSTSAVAPSSSQWRFSDVDRIVAISDVHGAFDAMVATLKNALILDEQLSWRGGGSHLVIAGDLVDRGPGSRRVIELVMRLESEAEKAGGRVHLLLGNHEVMNLIGDTRYVADEEYAAFADEESSEERALWLKRFLTTRHLSSVDIRIHELALQNEFDALAPPGFFAHRRAFSEKGTIGKWLLDKPMLIVINDTAFVHGGMPPFVTENGIDGVNRLLKSHLVGYLAVKSQFERNNVLSPVDQFRDHPAIIKAELNAGKLTPKLANAAHRLLELHESPLHGPEGPLWYRGSSACTTLVEGEILQSALRAVSARRAVIGHTTTKSRQIQQRLNGQVFEINTGMLNSSYGGSGNALVIEGAQVSVIGETGGARLQPIPAPLRVFGKLGGDELLAVLGNGDVLDKPTGDFGRSLVRVRAGTVTVFAYFEELPNGQDSIPDLAAFRLDQMLGLNMVPPIVVREIDGITGTLQLAFPDGRTELERVTSHYDDSQPCLVQKQLLAMYAFDALINNANRSPESMIYADDRWRLMLVEHRSSFSADPRSAFFSTDSTQNRVIGSAWRTALSRLDANKLSLQLGDVLSEKQLAALMQRRNALIDLHSNH